MTKKWDWQSAYSIGHDGIDKQHQIFFNWLNDFEQAVMTGQGGEQLSFTLEKLVSYAKHHFAFEERLMQQGKYAGLERHHNLHEAFKSELAGMIRKYAQGGLRALDLSQFVGDWLRLHILNEDQKIKEAISMFGDLAKLLE